MLNHDRFVGTEHGEIRTCLERAVRTDPLFAEAWSSLAEVYLDEHLFGYNQLPNSLDRALEAALRAVEIDQSSQHTHIALARVRFHRHEIGEFHADAERAISLNPNNVEALSSLGNDLNHLGDERGITLVRRAMALDPLHPTWLYYPVAVYHFDRGEYEEALAAAQRIHTPGLFWSPVYLVVMYTYVDRMDEARAAVEELLRMYPEFTTETCVEELRKWSWSDDRIAHWVAALRKAGVPEGAGEVE